MYLEVLLEPSDVWKRRSFTLFSHTNDRLCVHLLPDSKGVGRVCHTMWHIGQKLSSVQSLSRVRLFSAPWPAARQAYLSITNSWSLLKLMSIESVMPSNHLILCRPLLLLPSIFPSIRVFLNESVLCIRWPKYRSFSFGISPSLEYSGSISFRMDWLDLLAVQGTLKSLLQHHSSKASILASLVAQRLKHLPAMWETWVRSLGREDPLGKEMAPHSSILAWRIPWMEELGGLQSTGSQRVGNDWAT